jgi:16S rRNA (cytosine1402-N4)-methyltransferase
MHQSVLLEASLEGLNIQPAGLYVDATFGRGGHSQAILARLNPQGRLLALDQDPEAVAAGQALAAQDARFQMVHTGFEHLNAVLQQQQWLGKVNGILFDLGVSSPQLDNGERGFSFLRDGALDMRMNPSQGQSVAQWLATVKEEALANVLFQYGDERHSRRIAKAIVSRRAQQPFNHTLDLAEVIRAAHPRWPKGKHPATQSFQAMRIFINRELEQLANVLPQTVAALAMGGRLVVISFHSLEDRQVKRFIRQQSQGDDYPLDLPIPLQQLNRTLRPMGKAIRADDAQQRKNPRARSAVLRIAERLCVCFLPRAQCGIE